MAKNPPAGGGGDGIALHARVAASAQRARVTILDSVIRAITSGVQVRADSNSYTGG